MRRQLILVLMAISILMTSLPVLAQATEIEAMLCGNNRRYNAIQGKVIPEFEAANPGITVKLIKSPCNAASKQKLLTLIAGGAAPDIAFVRREYAPEFFRSGVFENLDPFVERSGFDVTRIPANTKPTLTYKGSYYGMPYDGFGFNVAAMYVNKDLFSEAGVAIPEADPRDASKGYTYDDLINVGKKLTKDRDGDGNLDQWGVDLSIWTTDRWLRHVWSFGGDLLNEQHTKLVLDRPKAVSALEYISDVMNVHGIMPKPEMVEGLGDVQANGKIAMFDGAMNTMNALRAANVRFDWTVMAMPRGPAGRIGIAGSNSMGMLSTSKHKEEVWKFMQYWLRHDVQRYLAVMTSTFPPQVTSVAQSDEFLHLEEPPYTREAFVFGESRTLPTDVPKWLQLQDLMKAELDLVWIGNKSAQEAADTIVRKGSDLLE